MKHLDRIFDDTYTDEDIEFVYKVVVIGLALFGIMGMISSSMGIYLL